MGPCSVAVGDFNDDGKQDLAVSNFYSNSKGVDIVARPTPTPSPTPTPGNVCTPTTTVTEGDLFPGGIASFGVTSGPGSVTIDHVNAGTGLKSLTVFGTPGNATVIIPAFTPGTYCPVTVNFLPTDPSMPVDFTLRAASTFHAIFIRVRCGTPPPPGEPELEAVPTAGDH
ncbi:MAG: FG-GAP repeat protein [Pyrinomonadaceae bacterium]